MMRLKTLFRPLMDHHDRGISQDLAECVVCTHTKLHLDEVYEDGMLPWDIEIMVEETLSEDEGLR
jgi:hypothetical protein